MPRFEHRETWGTRSCIFMPTTQTIETKEQIQSPTVQPHTGRLICLDVFRGLAVAGMILVDNPGSDDHAYWAIRHAEWNGWTSADFIFPSFLFLVGISMVFSFSARLSRGESRQDIFIHVLKRCLLLILIGLFVNGFPFFNLDLSTWQFEEGFSSLRFEGVTQRIALCYFCAAVLVLWSNRRGQLIALFGCLVGYWAILRFVPVPGLGVPGRDIPFMDPDRNIAAWLDRKLFMGHLYNGTRDPEGIISTIPAIGTTLIGVLAGQWLRASRSPRTKAAYLLGASVVGLIAGQVWNLWFPINKNLWTSSFALFSAGFALAFLGILYWLLEIKQWRGMWTMPVLVFGMNAIAGFVADSLVYGPGYSFTVQGPNGSKIFLHDVVNAQFAKLGASPGFTSLLYSLGALLFCWMLLWLLWRRRIFLKV